MCGRYQNIVWETRANLAFIYAMHGSRRSRASRWAKEYLEAALAFDREAKVAESASATQKTSRCKVDGETQKTKAPESLSSAAVLHAHAVDGYVRMAFAARERPVDLVELTRARARLERGLELAQAQDNAFAIEHLRTYLTRADQLISLRTR